MTDFWNKNTIISFIQFLLTNHFLTINHCSVNTTTSFIKTFWCCLTFSLCQTNLMIFLMCRLFWPRCNFFNLSKCLNQFQLIKYNRQLSKVFHPLTQSFANVKFAKEKPSRSTNLIAFPVLALIATYPSGAVTLNPSGVFKNVPIPSILFN